MPDHYPGYDVLSKRHTPSWNEQTRRAVDRRLGVPRTPRFFTEAEFAAVDAIACQIVPQPTHRPPVPVAALVDMKLVEDVHDGYRPPELPRAREAWRQGLKAVDQASGGSFAALPADRQHAVLVGIERGQIQAADDFPLEVFFKKRLLHDIVLAYWSHPTAWNEAGWGGPASPRGYVRMGYDERDPWEAAEAHDDPAAARQKNRHVARQGTRHVG